MPVTSKPIVCGTISILLAISNVPESAWWNRWRLAGTTSEDEFAEALQKTPLVLGAIARRGGLAHFVPGLCRPT